MGAELKVRVGINHAGFATGLRTMEDMVSGFAAKAGAALGAAVGVRALFEAAKGGMELADRLDDLSKRFDVSASKLQLLGNVASQEGASLEDVSSALKFLGKNAQIAAAGGSADLVAAFQAIGVSAGELRSLKPDELFLRLADAFSSGKLSGQEFSTTALLLGRGFEQLLPVLRKSREEIERIGTGKGLFTDDEIKRLSKIVDLMEKIANFTKTIAGKALLAGVKSGEDSLREFLGKMDGPFAERELAAMRMEDRAPSPRRDPNRKIKPSFEVEDINPGAKLKAEADLKTSQEQLSQLQRKRLLSEKASAEQLGQINAEAFALQVEINNLGNDKNKQLQKQIELEAKLVEQAGIQKNVASETAGFLENQARAVADQDKKKTHLQDLLAKEGGPQAEMALLESRAQDAAKAFKDMPSTDTATSLAEARGLLRDALTQQINDQPGTAPKGFAENEARRKLSEKGLGADLTGFTQKTDMSRPLEKLPDMANQLVAASKTLDQILEEIKKGDGSVFR